MKYIVVDLEMNNIRRGDVARRICTNEIIEIGAVMLDECFNEVSSFKTYVKPQYNSCIEKPIVRLTGITDATVEDAPTFSYAIKMFTDWCTAARDEIEIYSWSDTDFTQVRKEMLLKKYEATEGEASFLLVEWNDFQKEFDNYLGFERQLSLKLALQMAGVDFGGKEHDALDDARNTAELFQIFNDKERFNLTLKKIKEAMEPSSFGFSIGSIFDFSTITEVCTA